MLPTIEESPYRPPTWDYHAKPNRFRLVQLRAQKSEQCKELIKQESRERLSRRNSSSREDLCSNTRPATMCKTCRRPLHYQGDANLGPWGLRGAYKSVALTSRRLWSAQFHNEEKETGEVQSSLWSPADPPPVSGTDDCSKEDDQGKRDCAFANAYGGAPLSHTHAVPRAHAQVDGDEGSFVKVSDLREGSRELRVSGDVPKGSTISQASGASSGVKNGEITKAGSLDHHNGNSRHGRKIVPTNSPPGAVEVGVVENLKPGTAHTTTLEASKETTQRPFFFLPSEDEEESSYSEGIEQELRRDPDLYPLPKNGSDTNRSPTSPNDKRRTPLSPQSPLKQSAAGDTDEIKDRIRYCLQRARSRSTSFGGLGSFEAGLYRLEGLLEDKNHASASSHLRQKTSPTSKQLPSGHAAALMPKYKDAGTLTDVCTGDNVAEVELISLVQEQIPRYILRADTVTEFSGYDNADWGVSFPALKEEEAEALSPEQAEGALAYFVLCGNRVSQMTKTYNDIDAVTRLLQEKEKDLELAAKIGQQLLERNKTLEERNALLDAELSSASDKITQLKHDLQMKTDLLQIYTNDVDDTSSCETTPTGLRLINVDILQHRVKNLEDENRSLRQEASQLANDTIECEDKEKELVSDVIKQISDANLQIGQLSEELAKKVEDSLRQQEEITQLLAQVVDLQSRSKRLAMENDELANMVGVARDCQQELTMELAELKEKYAEVLDLLHDTQDQLRRVQKKNLPGNRGHHLGSSLFSSPFNSGNDSIASELHSLNSLGEELGKSGSSNMRRTFDTVRLTGKCAGSGSQGSLSSLGYGGSVHSTPTRHPYTPSHMATPTHMASSGGTYAMSYMGSQGSSVYSGGSGHPSLDSGADSDASMHTDSEDNYPGSHLGVPGWPGTPDLDSCLRRLGPGNRSGTPSHFLPYGCRTPDSIMSTEYLPHTGSGKSGLSTYGGMNASDWKLPQKLQIVKPIEGSLTLHQWSRLATPHLGGLLEEREGVAIKGGAGADQLNLDVYSMSDLEEDEVEEENPGKRFMSTSGVFTYTNSTILHPDDQTSLTPSLRPTQVSVLPTSSANVIPTPSTPMRAPSCPPSRRGSTATFSTNTGLAKMLNERGMNMTSGFSPTATPANSPTITRPGSPEPEGYKLPGLDDLTKTFHYGASLLRRTFYKDDPSAPQSPAGPRVNLVEQVQAIGVNRFVGSSDRALTVGGIVMSRPATSPLLHLSNLIMNSAKSSNTNSTTFSTTTTSTFSASENAGIMSAPKILSPGERRPTLPSGAPMGIPGHPGSGHLDNRLSQLKPGQRADLGTVGGRLRPSSLGSVPPRGNGEQNVGTVGWTSFGRKGGLL
ncbi:trafficking kinesin-binding protein 1-like isoform X4 [Cherax quadricarinatus]|uniref:trafficking kinesin-binding protein 1-like isoform X4 n=1 Tax=Cherax quadricarinatus TaxID=27406 RepID=UPI00387E5896